MKIEYIVCDTCGKTIDMEKTDNASGKFELARVRKVFGMGGTPPSPLSPFRTEKIGELATKEILEKVSIDTCEKCSTELETYCTALREKKIPKNTKNESTDSK